MKLLGWMHRKFNNGQSNSTHPLPDLPTGPTCNCLAGRPSPDDPRHHFFNPAPPGEGGEWMFQEPDFASPLLMEGLLAIGTFGSPVMMPTAEPVVEEQQIMEVEEIADKEMEETTENDLIVVKAELQKVLAAEEEKEMGSGDRISSATAVAGGKGDKECPLQGFLFGLPVEVGSTALMAPESRHDRRASLGELFMRSRDEEELLPMDKRDGLSAAKGMNVKMKKMLKRRRAVRGNTGGGKYEAVESNKIFKILRIFHKKIYPEAATDSSNYVKPSQPEEKLEKVCNNNYYNRKLFYENGSTAQESSEEGEGAISIPNPQPSKSLCKNKSRNREHWIKTDTDYLVLEL